MASAALAGFLGGALAKHHPKTYVYVFGDNLRAICERGLLADSVLLDGFTAHPKAASGNAQELGLMHVVLVCCKGCSLEAACAAISPMVGPQRVAAYATQKREGVVSDLMEPLPPSCMLTEATIHVFGRLEAPGHVVQSA